ncbi:MAG: hypothetical protein IKY92_05960 [Akkermansia sp.]|nr:hypothetical protein [Akkermansia sp.]
MPTITISTREDNNNRSMVQPDARLESGISLRPISLGSLEILRQLGNPLASGDTSLSNIDTHTLTEFIWVHAAPLDEVVDTVYNAPSQVGRKAALFAMTISPAELRTITASLSADQAAVQAASAIPQPDDTDSPNERTPR